MSGIAGEDLPEFWRGCITGTNRASVLARLRREGATVRARVLLDDTVNGPAVCTLIGTLDGTHADLRLLSFAPSAPQFPVAVSLTLDFRDNNQRATGSWASDVATAGVCELVAAHVPESVWWWKRGTTYAELGADYLVERDRQALERRHVRALEQLGYRVTLEPDAA